MADGPATPRPLPFPTRALWMVVYSRDPADRLAALDDIRQYAAVQAQAAGLPPHPHAQEIAETMADDPAACHMLWARMQHTHESKEGNGRPIDTPWWLVVELCGLLLSRGG